ncbi:MAG: glutamate mutase L [Burkholderiales bacterium]|nr:glutamate mutase L [Anaerolineae bacterium]
MAAMTQSPSPNRARSGSILAADFGNVHTRAVLIDVVDGIYRLVARAEAHTTSGFPVDDVSVGFRHVVEQISAATGRNFLDTADALITPERSDRVGVDTFIVTASTGRPLRTVLVGLVPEISIASGMRAVSGTYVQVVETLSLADLRSEEQQLNALLLSRPDLIFVTGGTEAGAQEPVLALARTVRLAVTLLRLGHKPTVLYAGNSALVPAIRNMFDGLTTLFVAPNVRPALDNEELEAAQLQLALAFDERSSGRGSGFEGLSAVSRLGVLPTAQSYALVVDYLGRTLGGGGRGSVLAVDVGSAVSTLAASVNRQLSTSIRTDIGLGHSAHNLLEVVGEEAVRRWLPFYASSSQIHEYALNKSLRPSTVPEALRDLYFEHALLRAGIEAMVQASRPAWNDSLGNVLGDVLPPFRLVILAGGALTGTGHAAYNAMLLLDALQPVGMTVLQSDPYGLIGALGALAHVNQEAVVQVLDGGGLERLGVAFSVSGTPKAGRDAMHIKITTEDKETVKHTVEGGHLWVFPLAPGRSARVEISAGRGLNIGGQRSLKLTLQGGTAGLIFDGRGRPLRVAADIRARAAQMTQWVHEVTGDPIREIDERWLTPPTVAVEKPVPVAAPQAEAPKQEAKAAKRGRGKGKDKDDNKPQTGSLKDLSQKPAVRNDDDMMDDLRDVLS